MFNLPLSTLLGTIGLQILSAAIVCLVTRNFIKKEEEKERSIG